MAGPGPDAGCGRITNTAQPKVDMSPLSEIMEAYFRYELETPQHAYKATIYNYFEMPRKARGLKGSICVLIVHSQSSSERALPKILRKKHYF